MLVLKKIWLFLKTHWYIPVIIIVGIVLLFAGKSKIAFELYKRMRGDYDAEINRLNELSKKEREEKEALQKKYLEIISKLESQYAVDVQKLGKEKEKMVKELIAKHKDNPEGLTEELAKEFGFIFERSAK
jgi:Skp family chaperone for outer membrane proteins